ncbi:MAG: hypothetical protein IPP32_10550 [Bacteroidetes bacterium]|nr:hypothetical protein [Bacteroidota bacterium]
MTKILLMMCFSISLTSYSIAQQSSFLKTYNGNNDLSFLSVDTVHDGGYIISGVDCVFHGCNFMTIKADSIGNEIWRYENNEFNGNSSGYLDNGILKIRETYDHGFIAIGSIRTDSTIGNYDGLVAKIDSSGTLIWKREYDFSNYDRFIDVYLEDDSSFVISGKAFDKSLLLKLIITVTPFGVNSGQHLLILSIFIRVS